MSRFRSIERDDENDTRLFDKLEEYVLKHYPNPERIGCLDHDTLCDFVETPEKLDLADLKYLHIFKCAECTRELMELRRIREERVRLGSTGSSAPLNNGRTMVRKWKWRLAAAVRFVSGMVVRFVVKGGAKSSGLAGTPPFEDAVSETIDLSRGAFTEPEIASHEQPATLPRKLVDLHLVLPKNSPAGTYRVTVAKDRNLRQTWADAVAFLSVRDSHCEVYVRLDLRLLTRGSYFLSAVCEDGRAAYFYPLLLG